jgi:predicted DNA-binding protein
MHKNGDSVISISIGTKVKIRRRSLEINKPLIKASHVSFYPSQMKKLEEVAQREGRAKAEVIREVVRRFLTRPTFERNTFNFDAGSAKGTERIYPCFSKSDWKILDRVSKKPNRHRIELVREAVDWYLRESS